MTEISLLDKLKVVFSMSTNVFNIAILVFLAFISFLFITTNKNNAKESKKAYLMLYVILFIVILAKYYNGVSTMFDYFMNNLFTVIYFPNIAVFIGALIVSNIIMLISIFNTTTKKFIKVLNVIMSSIMDYLFILTLTIINSKNINVFDMSSMYSNTKVHSIIELSSNIFILWISFLIIYKIIITILERNKQNEITKLSVEHVGKKNKIVFSLPEYVKETNAPVIIKRDERKPEIVYETSNNKNTAIYEDMLTLDDYKLLVSLLKEEKLKNKIEEIEKHNEEKINTSNDLLSLYK